MLLQYSKYWHIEKWTLPGLFEILCFGNDDGVKRQNGEAPQFAWQIWKVVPRYSVKDSYANSGQSLGMGMGKSSMGKATFENYGFLAKQPLSFTEQSGRYPSQSFDERRILGDVMAKLEISPEDSLIDIGCGLGLLLLPLSFVVNRALGIDHPEVIAALQKRIVGDQVSSLCGNFLDVDTNELSATKILCYGVLQNLATESELYRFLDKALAMLEPGGKMLIGDISNIDRKGRFLASRFGQDFEKKWAAENRSETHIDKAQLLTEDKRIEFTDELVCAVLLYVRRQGFESFVLPQRADLPFGYSREDILIEAHR